jgi:hypothetical protein
MTPETQFIIKAILWGLGCLCNIALVIGHIRKGNKDAAIGWLVAFVWCVTSLKT